MVPAAVTAVNPKISAQSRDYLLPNWRVFSCQIGMFDLSAPNLIGGLVFGSIGFIAFIYGKLMTLWKPMFCGIALMVFPYFVENTAMMFAIGSAATIALFFLRS